MFEINKILTNSFNNYKNKDAIICGNSKFTYNQVDQYSDKITKIIKFNTTKSQKICIMLPQSFELISSIVASLKCNMTFVNLNIDQPIQRLRIIFNELMPEWIVIRDIDKKIISELTSLTYKTYYLDNQSIALYNIKYPFETVSLPEDTPYIYFTSGSTGTPKGIMGNGKGLVQFIQWEINYLSLDNRVCVSQLTPPSFDPFLRDIFVPLCCGGTICIPNKEALQHPRKFASWINEEKVSLIHIVPSLFKVLFSLISAEFEFLYLKHILLAGELLRCKDLYNFYQNYNSDNLIDLYNLYGPTETTLAKFCHKINRDDLYNDIIPVGVPIDLSTRAYVINDIMEIQAIEEGEVYISTDYVSNGYLNDNQLTQERFVSDTVTGLNAIMYKTGDNGKLLSDGSLVITGRIDNMFKIGGQKVQPEEIEIELLKYNSITNTVVFLFEDIATSVIIACYTGERLISSKELHLFLIDKLPEYMIPINYVYLKDMPLNNNGKIDRYKTIALAKEKITIDNSYSKETDKSIKGLILNLVHNIFSYDITEDILEEPIKSIGFQSINYIQMIVDIEEALGIEISDESLDIDYFLNLQELINYLSKKILEK